MSDLVPSEFDGVSMLTREQVSEGSDVASVIWLSSGEPFTDAVSAFNLLA